MKKNLLRFVSFVLVFVVCFGVSAMAYAAEISEEAGVGYIALPEAESGEGENIAPCANTNFSFSLPSNTSQRSSETYYITQGVDSLYISTLTWSPSGQTLKVGFYNVDTKKVNVISVTGGSVSGKTITTSNVPTGEYRIYVENAGSVSVSGSISYTVS